VTDRLELEGVRAGYGGAVVIEDISLTVEPGECVALLGRNGVGKTTLVTTIMGFTRLHAGSIRWSGTSIEREPPQRRATAGISWVPQERRTWRSLTVVEHLTCVARPGPWTPAKALALFPRLAERRVHRGSQLSGGEQQMLAIARALVTNPRLLLLDEPMEGLAPVVVQELAGVLRSLAAAGTMSMLLVEQHAEQARALSRRVMVMERGRLVQASAGAPT